MKVVTIGGVMYEDPGDGWLVAVAEESNGSSASSASSAPAAPWLDPSSAALRGLAGDVVRAVEPHTEADPAGLLFVLLAHIGAMVGNRTEARAGATRHPPTLFVVLAGRSSHSRKDTAAREIEAICDRVDDGWAQTHRLGGFGSGEAIVATAAEHPGEPLYISESEFARLLAVGSRDGSTVSPVLRACWDFRRIQYRTRKDTFDAPAAPVALVGHITADELLDSRTGLRPVEILSGFGNRVLWAYVDRRHLVPDGEPVPDYIVNPLVTRLGAALDGATQTIVRRRSPDAQELWREIYAHLGADDPPGAIGHLTARAEAQLLRLSLIYSVLDRAEAIEVEHLGSAFEAWRYSRWSAQHIFVGAGTGDRDVDRIAAVLGGGGELTARDLDRMFAGHRSTQELRDRAVAYGVAAEVKRTTGGRPSVALTLAEKAEEADKALTRAWWTRPRFRFSASSATSAGGSL